MADSILDKVLSSKHAEEVSHFSPQEILTRLLAPLLSRERDILIRRFGLQGGGVVTLEEIGKSLEVTRERIRQIERSAIKKMKDGAQCASLMTTVEHVIRQYLEEADGALVEEELYTRLAEQRDRPEESRAILTFFLNELLRDRFQRIVGDTVVRDGWALRFFALPEAKKDIIALEKILEEKNVPVDFTPFARMVRERGICSSASDDKLQSLLGLSRRIEQNTFGEWGLSSWTTVHPKRMKDKIYLILKRQGKPLHFNAITELINGARFDQKVAHPPTVHNELIMDERFVLIGRGIYALAEWGYKPGIVADVVADLLKKEGKPLDRGTIVRHVLTQRMVGKATIHLALMDRVRFTKLPDGTYTVNEQKVQNV